MKKVLISGGWDIMHFNHVKTLLLAKGYGDYLIVNVCSDERMRAKKGMDRPFIPLIERMFVVSSLAVVDKVISIPGEEYPLFKAIDEADPEVVCVNIDEQSDVTKEIKYCRDRGIEFIGLHRIDDGISTTKLIERLRGKHA